jgi:hypothetical protein
MAESLAVTRHESFASYVQLHVSSFGSKYMIPKLSFSRGYSTEQSNQQTLLLAICNKCCNIVMQPPGKCAPAAYF